MGRAFVRVYVLCVAVGVASASCGARTGSDLFADAPDTDPDAAPNVALDRDHDASPPRDAMGRDAMGRDAMGRDVIDVDAPPPPNGRCCGDEQNTSYPPDDNCAGATLAWQYVPTCNFSVARIEIHRSGGGEVALLDSDGTRPGATLFRGTLPTTATSQWVGADVRPPIALHAGQVYWIEESAGQCSIATDGVQYPYYGYRAAGWDGPYHWHPWTSHVIGMCF